MKDSTRQAESIKLNLSQCKIKLFFFMGIRWLFILIIQSHGYKVQNHTLLWPVINPHGNVSHLAYVKEAVAISQSIIARDLVTTTGCLHRYQGAEGTSPFSTVQLLALVYLCLAHKHSLPPSPF